MESYYQRHKEHLAKTRLLCYYSKIIGKQEVLELKEKHGLLKTLEILQERQDLLRFQKKERQFKQKYEKFILKENDLKLFSQPIL